VLLDRSPGRRHRSDTLCDEAIALPVAAHHPESGPGPIRDPEARPGQPAGVRDGLRARDGPAHAAVRLEHDELVPAGRRHEEPTGRPRRVSVVAEATLRAVRANDPDTLRRGDEQAPRRRERVERGTCVRASGDDILDPAANRAPGRREREDRHRCGRGCGCEQRKEPSLGRQGLARLPCSPNDVPASPLRFELVGRVHGEELLTEVHVAHGPTFGL